MKSWVVLNTRGSVVWRMIISVSVENPTISFQELFFK